jgi:hypothetical protein
MLTLSEISDIESLIEEDVSIGMYFEKNLVSDWRELTSQLKARDALVDRMRRDNYWEMNHVKERDFLKTALAKVWELALKNGATELIEGLPKDVVDLADRALWELQNQKG